MFARVATFEGGDLEAMRSLNNEMMVKDRGAALPAGILRTMVLEGEKRLVITFFENRAELEVAEQRFAEMGDEIPESVRGRRVGLDSYEIIFDAESAAH